MSTIDLHVQDMTCGSCVRHVTQALNAITDVDGVEVDLRTGMVRVGGNADSAALIAALDEAGYPAQVAASKTGPAATKTGCCCR